MTNIWNTQPSQADSCGRLPAGISWPGGKRFAFTIFDDTDGSTTENISPIYCLLRDLGFRTTKSVWLLKSATPSRRVADTCADPAHLTFVCELQRAGFEIGLHNATWDTSTRSQIVAALQAFQKVFGDVPTVLAQHGDCNENIYWGDARVSGIRRLIYRGCRSHASYHPAGHVQESPFFWGDLCQSKIKYIRNFVYLDINTLKVCPEMPYHDPQRPYVRYWFASSDGCDPEGFVRLLCPANQDQLEEEGGACIVYTHLYNFSRNGAVLPEVKQILRRLATRNGWFVPVGTLLDFLRASRPDVILTNAQRRRLEWHWLHDVMLTHAGEILRHVAR